MSENIYLKSYQELEEWENYYTQLEKWKSNEYWTQHFYIWKYINSKTIENLIDNNQEDIANILLDTYTIPVSYNEKLIVDQNTSQTIINYLFSIQSEISQVFETSGHALAYHKYAITNKYFNPMTKLFFNHGATKEKIEKLINNIYNSINEDISKKIELYNTNNEQEANPIENKIIDIKNIFKSFLSQTFSKKKIENIIIDDEYNIVSLITSIRNYLYELYYPQENSSDINDTEKTYNDYLEAIKSLQETTLFIEKQLGIIETEWETWPLSNNIFSLIKNIKTKPISDTERNEIWEQLENIYIRFINEMTWSDTIESLKISFHLREYFDHCTSFINEVIESKKYKYDNISPLSLLWLFHTLQQEYKENNYTKVLETISELQNLSTEEFQQLDKQEIKELETILRSEEVQARELLGKIRDLI